MKNLLKTLIVIIANCTMLLFNCDAANRFWIAGSTGDWNSTTNWSTSSGGSGGASVPGSSDVAKFDGNGTGNCTINATVNVAGVDIGSGYTGTISQGSYLVTVGSSHYIQADGTWTGGSVKMTVNGKLALNGGTFTATSDTLYIGHDGSGNTFIHSGGTFNHNNGAVYFTAGANSDIIDVLSSTQFYNVIAGITYYYSIKSATNDTIKIANNFYHKSGYLGGTWQLQGNLKVTTSAGVNNLEGQLIFTGTSNQTYEYSAGKTGRIKINKTAGTVTPASGTTDFSIQGFVLEAGSFTAPTGNFKIGGSSCNNLTVFKHNGGTFDANSGTLVFESMCYYNIFTIDVLSSTVFNNVTANPYYLEVLKAASGDTIKVEGNFNHKTGDLEGIWQVKGNLKVEGGNSGFQNKEALIILTGTNNQTYEYTTGRTGRLKINKASGTVTPLSGTTNLSAQGLILEAGSFTAPTGDFKIGGKVCTNKTIFTQTGGTFTHNNGTVVFDPYCYSGFFTVDVNSSTLFNHVTSNPNIYESVKSASGDTVKIDGNFYHKTGDLGGIWEFKGNLKVESGSTGAYNQDGLVIFGGTANQTYEHAGGYATRIKVNKGSGTVEPASGTTTLNSQGLILDAGNFTAPSGEFKIGGPYNSSTYTTIFIQTGGTFTHNSGTVVFNPTNYWYDYKVDVISSTLFNNVTAQHFYSRYLKVETGDTLKMAGNFNHYSGDLGGIWDLKGNLIVSSSSAIAGYAAQEGLIIFSGTANQTYSYTAGNTNRIKIDKPSGAVSAASGTTDFKVQGFSLASGTFTAPSGSFYIGNNRNCTYTTVFSHSAGTFNHNNGRVILNPATCSGPFLIDIIPTTRFYDFTDNHQNAAQLNLASGDTLHVANEMKFMMGLFNTGVIAVKGKVIATPGNGVNAQLLFCGTADQDFDLTGYTNYYNGHIKINKPSGKVNLLSACVLDASSQTLTFVKGTIATTATNLLTLGDNVTVSGMSDSSYVAGPMKKTGNDAFTFPVGKNGHYRKIGISAPASTTDAFTAEYFEQNSNDTYSHSAKDGTLAELSRNEYWNLARTTGTSNVSVTLSIDSATSCSVDNLSNLKVAAWDPAWGGTGGWADKGNGGTSGNVYVGTVVTNGVSNVYGVYALGTSTNFICNPGTSCADVIELGSGDTCLTDINMANKEMWFSFIADSSYVGIEIYNPEDSTNGYVSEISLFDGDCNSLDLRFESFYNIDSTYERMLNIYPADLIYNETYYINLKAEHIPSNYQFCLKNLFTSITSESESEGSPCGGLECTNNLIINGDFDMGNTGFESDLSFVTTINNPNQYTITTNPNDFANNHFGAYGGYLTGGPYMVCDDKIDGEGQNSILWRQIINVEPNTYYCVSAMARNVVIDDDTYTILPNLQLKVYGVNSGVYQQTSSGPIPLSSAYYGWKNAHMLWYSGSYTSAGVVLLSIPNGSANNGNDIGIDHITFKKITPSLGGINSSGGCSGVFNFYSSHDPEAEVEWNFGDGTTSTEVNPTHTYSQPGQYVVRLIAEEGCDGPVSTCTVVTVTPSSDNPSGRYNVDCCSNEYNYTFSNLTMTSSSSIITDCSIKGTLLIKAGVTCTILSNSVVQFGPWGKIIIEPTAELKINGGAILRGLESCGTMWQGIEVWGNSNLTSNDNEQGKITIYPNVEIRDAHNAVVLGRFKTISCGHTVANAPFILANSGGIIEANDVSFKNNAIAVRFAPYIHSNSSTIQNCSFESNALLDPGYDSNNSYRYPNNYNRYYASHNTAQKGHAHINMWKTRMVKIYDNSFSESVYGVEAFDSRYLIKKNTGTGNEFTNHNIAIRSLHTLSPAYYGSTINDNSINNTGDFVEDIFPSGVQVFGGKYYQINNNEFNTNSNENEHLQSYIGIGFQNSSSFIVTGNAFKMYQAGVYVESSSLLGGWIGPDDGGTANGFSYTKNGTWVQGNNMNLKIRCNNYSNPLPLLYTRNWMVLNQLADQGEQTDLIENDDKKPAGNEFAPLIGGQPERQLIESVNNQFTYYHHDNSPNGVTVIPYVETGSPIQLYNTFVDKIATSCEPEVPPCCFAVGIATGTATIMDLLEQKEDLISILDGGETEELLDSIADEEMDEDDLEDLLNEHYPLSDEVLTAFIGIYERLPYKNFKDVIKPNQPLSETVYSLLLAAIAELSNEVTYELKYAQTHSDSVTVAQIERSIGHTAIERQLLMNFGVKHFIENDSIEYAIDLLENDTLELFNKESKQTLFATYLEDALLEDAQAMLDEFEPETEGDEDWKNLMQMELDLAYDTLTVFEMDSTQEALVRAIAYTGETSLAKANAQSILALVFGEEFELELNEPSGKTDEDEGASLEQEGSENTVETYFNLYPNPTTGNINLKYKVGETDKAVVEVFNILGEKKYESALGYNAGIKILPVASYGHGIFLYRIFVNGKNVSAGKIVVL